MSELHSLENVFYPPVGIVHISGDIADLVSPYLGNKQSININCSAQPNSHPHLGTVTTLFTGFALAQYLGRTLDRPASVTFDQLENAPADQRVENGIEYQISLGDTKAGDRSLADVYMDSFRRIFDTLSDKTGIPYVIRPYVEFQKIPAFRRSLLAILNRSDEFAPFLSPREKVIRFRFPCPVCQWVDKSSSTVEIAEIDADHAVLTSQCFEHGEHRIEITESGGDFIDTNTPLRDVAKGVALIEEAKDENKLIAMCDGGDWAGTWLLHVFSQGISRLGYEVRDFPVRFFAPLITDWSGAKFSKSLYVESDAYQYLPQGLLNFSEFMDTYGNDGFDRLWAETQSWVSDAKKLFRNYSVDYIRLLLEGR